MDLIQQGMDMTKGAINKLINDDEKLLLKLAESSHIVIDQTPDWIELCCICEKENVYELFQSQPDFVVPYGTKPFGKFKESSSCFCRCCLKMAREFKGNLEIENTTVAKLDAPYKCHNPIPNCSCCFSKPFIGVNSHNNEPLGTVQMPCWCPMKGWGKCDLMELRVLDRENNLQYMIHQTCCQKSVLCMPFQCCGCPNIVYEIKNTKKEVVGKITNTYNECAREVCSRADRFGIEFPDNAEPHKKLLIVMAAIWIDYLQYLA